MYNLFDKEEYYGNIEYKLIINPLKNINLITQFFFRLREGGGKCFYIIGIDDNGCLHFKNFKIIYKNTFYFINLVKKFTNYKVRFFYNNQYIYSIISFYNYNFINNYNLNDFNNFI